MEARGREILRADFPPETTHSAQTGHSHSYAILRCSPSDRPFVDRAAFFVFSNVGQRTLQTFEGPKLDTVMLKKKRLKNRPPPHRWHAKLILSQKPPHYCHADMTCFLVGGHQTHYDCSIHLHAKCGFPDAERSTLAIVPPGTLQSSFGSVRKMTPFCPCFSSGQSA